MGAVAAMAAVAGACVPPSGTVPNQLGPHDGPRVATVELTGAYEYATSGPVLGGDLVVERADDGTPTGLRGTALVPGRGAAPARLGFDLDLGPLGAVGSLDLVDPAAGLGVTTPVLAAPVRVTAGRIEGELSWTRLFRVVELVPYELRWSVADGSAPAPPPPPAAPAATEGTFSAITYNVAGLPEPISGSRPATFSPLLSPLLRPYDLVLLQEDFNYQPEVASRIGLPHGSEPQRSPFGSDPTRSDAIVGSGLERYSAWPFADERQVRWPGCFGGILPPGAADCLSQKGFSVARQTIAEGVTLDVVNLHGEAGSTPEDEAWSEAGYRALAAYLNANHADRPLLVGGDFNLSPLTPTDLVRLEALKAATGLIDVCDVLDCSSDPGAIDRFLFRPSADLDLEPTSWSVPRAQFSLPDGTPLSDHDPTVVELRWALRSAR